MRFLGLLLCIICLGLTAQAADQVRWHGVADDLETAETTVSSGVFFNPDITLVRSSLRRYRIGVVSAASFGKRVGDVRELSKLSQATVGINANFFDEQAKPLGLVVSRGTALGSVHRGGSTLTGIFFATRNALGIVSRDNFSAKEVVEAVQAGPRIIVDGSATDSLRSLSSSSRRAGVCIDSAKRVVFYLISSVIGVSLDNVQETLLRPGIDCRHALNLDGGGSAQLYIEASPPGAAANSEEVFISGSDEVPTMLGLFVKQDN